MLEGAPILWVLDFDSDWKNDLVQETTRVRNLGNAISRTVPFEVVFMVQEYETIFLSDHETVKKFFDDIRDDYVFPSNPELVRDAKGAISKARPRGFAYKPTQHQRSLTSQVSLSRLRERSDSFRRFECAVLRLLEIAV